MALIKDLTKVKDEEISLLDVKRAEEIIARANKLLGRKETCSHYYGWNYWPLNTWFSTPNYVTCQNNASNGLLLTANGNVTNGITGLVSNSASLPNSAVTLTSSIVDAAKSVNQ